MPPESGCQRFAEALLHPGPPPADLAAHLLGCESCRETRELLAAVRHEGSAFPAAEVDRVTARVLAKSLPPAPPPSAPLFPLLGGLVLGLTLAGFGWLMVRTAPVAPGSVIAEKTPRGQEMQVVLSQGQRTLQTPDGSEVRLEGECSARLQPRGLELYWGRAQITVRTGGKPFTAATPRALVQAASGSFGCLASASATRIISQDAHLTVIPRGGGKMVAVGPGMAFEVADPQDDPVPASGPRPVVPPTDRQEDPR